MDYRSPFELRQQLLEEARAAKTSSPRGRPKSKSGKAPDAPVAPPVVAAGRNENKAFSASLPDDPTALVREVPGAENIKALNEALEHDEAVQRYLENQNLSLEESAKYIMANGSATQKMSFFRRVEERLADVPAKSASKVLSILCESMWAQDPELQCHAPGDLSGMLPILSSTICGELFEVTRTMLTVKTAAVRVAWGQLLLRLIAHMTVAQLEKDVVPLALKKTEHAEPQDQRELSCDALGAVCTRLPADKVELLVLPKALALCQDTNGAVRQHMCAQLGTIARALGIESAKARVAPDLFELLNDEERTVSRTAFSCLIDLVEFFGPEYRRERLYPIIKTFISNPPSEVVSLLVVEFGRFLHEIKADITSQEDVILFAKFYQSAANKQDEDARRRCAYNLPAVASSLPISVFPTHLSQCLDKLATDPLPEVRRSIASGLHELVPILGDRAAQFLEQPFLALLRDRDPSVRAAVFAQLTPLMDCFVKQTRGAGRQSLFRSFADAGRSLAEEGLVSWRNMDFAMQLLWPYQSCFDSATLMDQLVPVLLAYVKDGAYANRQRCAAFVCQILCASDSDTAKVQLFGRLNHEFARSPSCYQRRAYFLFAREICTLFSRRCIRERLLECCYELQRDSVPMVRTELARSLPLLQRGLLSRTSAALEEEFTNVLQRLLMDDDECVRLAAQDSNDIMMKADRARRMQPTLADEEEAKDRKLEQAEQFMLDQAKDADKAERRAKLRDLLKNERDKDLLELPTNGKRSPKHTVTRRAVSKNGGHGATPPAPSRSAVSHQKAGGSVGVVAVTSTSTPAPGTRRRL